VNAQSNEHMVPPDTSRPASAKLRLKELGFTLPAPPEPFGTYVEAVQTGKLLFLTGMFTSQADPGLSERSPCERDGWWPSWHRSAKALRRPDAA
jgi:hypothetical protein